MPTWIDGKITAGNIITVVLVIIGFVWGYGNLNFAVEQLKIQRAEDSRIQLERSKQVETAIKDISDKRDALLDKLVTSMSTISERVIRVETKQDILLQQQQPAAAAAAAAAVRHR
jgi:hypothetical protein